MQPKYPDVPTLVAYNSVPDVDNAGNQLVMLGTLSGVPPTAYSGIFAKNCLIQRTDAATAYFNTGTSAAPVWSIIEKSATGTQYFAVNKVTTGTTPVNVIAATVPFACTITGVYVISQDTTAGNITVADTAGTVATIAKGTVAGAMTGAVSLANTSVAAGNTLTIVSSSAGNADVFINFTIA